MVAAVAACQRAGPIGAAVPGLSPGPEADRTGLHVAGAHAALGVIACAAGAAAGTGVGVAGVAIVAELLRVDHAIGAEVCLARSGLAVRIADGAGEQAIGALLGHDVAVITGLAAGCDAISATADAAVGCERKAGVAERDRAGSIATTRPALRTGRYVRRKRQTTPRIAGAGARLQMMGAVAAHDTAGAPTPRCVVLAARTVCNGTTPRVADASAGLQMVGRIARCRSAGAIGAAGPSFGRRTRVRCRAGARIARAEAALRMKAGTAGAAVVAGVRGTRVAVVAELGRIDHAVGTEVGLAGHALAAGVANGTGALRVATLLRRLVSVVAALARLHAPIAAYRRNRAACLRFYAAELSRQRGIAGRRTASTAVGAHGEA